MYLLPKMGPENLDQGDLESRNLAVQEDAGQVQLHLRHVSTMTVNPRGLTETYLETNIDVCPVYCL